MDKKISIVIPVYNSEKTIGKTISSILKQTYENFEIILVDDGSTDESQSIIKSFDDKRIIYNVQENQGVSTARNNGIALASGEYISFIDSDDIVKECFLEDFIKALNKNPDADLITCKFVRTKSTEDYESNESAESNSQTKEENEAYEEYSGNKIYKFLYEEFNGYCFNKIYKKSIIDENKIRFDKTIFMGEDLLFNFEFLSHSKKAIGFDSRNYIYVVNENSLSKSKTSLKWFSILDSYEKVLNLNLDLDKFLESKIIYSYYKYILESKTRLKENKTESKEIKEKIKNAEKRVKKEFGKISSKDKIKLIIFMLFPSLSYKYLQNKKRANIQN